MAQVGDASLMSYNWYGQGQNADAGPQGVFNHFNRKTNQIDPYAAKLGGLLFINSGAAAADNYQQGFLHVCFALGDGRNYGANSNRASPNIGISAISGFYSDSLVYPATAINMALDMPRFR